MARTPTPEEGHRSALIAVRTTQSTKDAVEAAAKADGRTVSDWLLRLVEAALKKAKR